MIEHIEKLEKKIINLEQCNGELIQCNDSMQMQLKHMRDDNNTTIELNNDLTAKLSECTKVILEFKQSSMKMNEELSSHRKLVSDLKDSLNTKEKIIEDYDKRFEEMEEEVQTVVGEQHTNQIKVNSRLVQLQKEVKALHKEREELLLVNQKEASHIAQERIDTKKTIQIMEKNLECLVKEKAELEEKLNQAKSRPERKFQIIVDKEVQTEFPMKFNNDINGSNGNSSIANETDMLAEQLIQANRKLKESSQILQKNEKELQEMKSINTKLTLENVELRSRRAKAIAEMSKLAQERDSSQQRGKGRSKRYSSEAVFPSIN